MRDKLIKLLKEAGCAWDRYLSMCVKIGEVPNVGAEEFLADCLLQDRVIVLPCKPGDTVYQTDGFRVYESRIDEITIAEHQTIYFTENIAFDDYAIGKGVFLKQEEAEQALKEGEQG